MRQKPNLDDAHLAALRLLLLPDDYEKLSDEEQDFLCSDLVGELLGGRYAHVFDWVKGVTRNSKWILTLPIKPQ